MPAIVIIPCRFASTRFPGKPLQSLHGKPMIQHVYERAGKAKKIKDTFIATDSEIIYNVVKGFGGKVVMTSESHQSGTDRIAEALLTIESIEEKNYITDIVVNVQGDEPLIESQMVDDVIELVQKDNTDIGTLARRIDNFKDITDPNVVKVVFDKKGLALYFSRSPIPYYRDFFDSNKQIDFGQSKINVYKHIGIYAYRKDVLLNFVKLPISPLEEAEKLEQLRALENGFKIKVKITPYETIGVDTPEDLQRVRKWLSTYS